MPELCTYSALIVNRFFFCIVHQLSICLTFKLQEGHHRALDYAGKTLTSCEHSTGSRKCTLYFKKGAVPDTLGQVAWERLRHWNMPQYCCVPRCMNKGYDGNGVKIILLSFHKFPEDKELFRKWIIVLQRDIGKEFRVTDYMRVCSRLNTATNIFLILKDKLTCSSCCFWFTLSYRFKHLQVILERRAVQSLSTN